MREYAFDRGVEFELDDLNYLIVNTKKEKLELSKEFCNADLNVFTNMEIKQNFLGGNANLEKNWVYTIL